MSSARRSGRGQLFRCNRPLESGEIRIVHSIDSGSVEANSQMTVADFLEKVWGIVLKNWEPFTKIKMI